MSKKNKKNTSEKDIKVEKKFDKDNIVDDKKKLKKTDEKDKNIKIEKKDKTTSEEIKKDTSNVETIIEKEIKKKKEDKAKDISTKVRSTNTIKENKSYKHPIIHGFLIICSSL